MQPSNETLMLFECLGLTVANVQSLSNSGGTVDLFQKSLQLSVAVVVVAIASVVAISLPGERNQRILG